MITILIAFAALAAIYAGARHTRNRGVRAAKENS